MVKFGVYAAGSLLACAGLLYYTYITRQQFYPSVIYLVTSKISVLILGNAGLVLTVLFARLVKTIFLGTLRDAEVELLHENVRYAITETCLALTIFRDEINFHVVVLFTSLVFLKVFHWLSQSRIEFIEQSDVVTRLTHTRLVTLMAGLGAVDLAFVVACALRVLDVGPSVFILFGFEFLILLVTLVATFLRYVLYVIDTRRDGNWPNKFTYLFYLELVSEVVKLVVYLVFFLLIFSYYGMPLHIVRDLWVSIKNLQRRIASYFRYRKITAHLHDRFPTPTADELAETDRTCIICREEMLPEACKKLPCSHIFHVDCLKMWVQRQQTCPTCRSTIPTGPRPAVVPETPAAAPAAPAAPVVAPGQPHAAAPVAPPAVPPFAIGHHAAGLHGAAPAPAPAPAAPVPTPVVPAPAHGAAAVPPQPAAGAHQPPMLHPYAHGFPPFLPPPYMYGGTPYGVGFGMPGAAFGMGIGGHVPPFGFPFGMPFAPAPAAPGQSAAPGVSAMPMMDPDAIQRQIELLHAQLAMLQAAHQGFQMPTSASASVPAPSEAAPSEAAPSEAAPSEAAPSVAANTSQPPPSTTTATAPAQATSANVDAVDDELEEKRSAPAAPAATGDEDAAPVESRVPPAPQTEAERRRDELRQRYNRIYTDATSSSGDGVNAAAAGAHSSSDDSKSKDE